MEPQQDAQGQSVLFHRLFKLTVLAQVIPVVLVPGNENEALGEGSEGAARLDLVRIRQRPLQKVWGPDPVLAFLLKLSVFHLCSFLHKCLVGPEHEHEHEHETRRQRGVVGTG